jgi:hypothetical protein
VPARFVLPSALIAALALLVLPERALAYRPFDGTDAAVADQGEVEIEFGPFGYLREGSNRFLVVPSLVLNFGFASGWEAVLEGNQAVGLGPISGQRLSLTDTSLSLKHVLVEGALQEKSGVSVATEFGPLLPTVNGEPGMGAEWALIASARSEWLTVHGNAAVEFTRVHTYSFIGDMILEVHDTWPVRPVFEIIGAEDLTQGFTASALAGAIWRLRDSLSFDAAVRVAREGPTSVTEVRAGLTWAFATGTQRGR